MLMRSYRRSLYRRIFRACVLVFSVVFLFDLLSLLKDYRQFSENLLAHTYTELSTLPLPVQNQKIFVVAQFWTSAAIIEETWGDALVDLVTALGVENVYVSIYESGSLDNTKDALRNLDQKLARKNVARTITLDPTTHADEIAAGPYDEEGNPRTGWVQTLQSHAGKELRRIPYLARTRNQSLKPLHDLHSHGRTFDKVLFLNDVVYRSSDVFSLLATNQGSYAAACAMDFHLPPAYYDTFALRDSDGHGTIMTQFPYFRSADSLDSFLKGRAAKVQSCWNGMMVMEAGPFYNDPASGAEGLQFRAVKDSLASKHVDASECCLIHADLIATRAAGRGIYVNPSVRVGYTARAYELTHSGTEATFVTTTQYVSGVWLNRIKQQISSATRETQVVMQKYEKWKKESVNSLEKREEPGIYCAIDELHILIWNGWKHV